MLQMSCLDMVYHSEFYWLCDVCVTIAIVVSTDVISQQHRNGISLL
jgi:hypothetical protein